MFPFEGGDKMERRKLMDCRGNRSRQEVAKHLDITPQMLGAIERGDRTPSLSLAKKISDYFGLPIDDIFFEQSRNVTFPSEEESI